VCGRECESERERGFEMEGKYAKLERRELASYLLVICSHKNFIGMFITENFYTTERIKSLQNLSSKNQILIFNNIQTLYRRFTPMVNFINILRALFSQYPFDKKLQIQNVKEKSCPEHFFTKNARW